MTWSLESELRSILQSDDVIAGFKRVGAIAPRDQVRGLEVIDDWYRAGAETFLLVFDIVREGNSSVRLALKACTPQTPRGGSVKDVLEQWLGRRRLLAKLGVSTPALFGTSNGVLLEEYVPYALDELMQDHASEQIVVSLARTMGIVCRAGFSPVALPSDMRSRGNDAVLVDFGSDLGSPTSARSEDREDHDLASLKYLMGTSNRLASIAREVYRRAASGVLPH